MDAFTYQQNRTKTVPWMSLNWEGTPVEPEEQQNTDNNQSTLAELFITTRESVEVFKRVFAIKKLSQIAISLGDLQGRMNQWLKLESIDNTKSSTQDTDRPVQKDSPTLRPRPNLQTVYVAPRTSVELIVANLWQKLLGIERVGIYDNYFELGGHSLIAVRLMSQIQRKFGQNLPLATLFQSPTIEKLASVRRSDNRFSTLVSFSRNSASWCQTTFLLLTRKWWKCPLLLPISELSGTRPTIIWFTSIKF